jgi:hypothetical protein
MSDPGVVDAMFVLLYNLGRTCFSAHEITNREVLSAKPDILQPYLLRLLFFQCCSISVFCNQLLLLRGQHAFGFN